MIRLERGDAAGQSGAGYGTRGVPSSGPEGLFSGYGRDPAFYDELFDQDGVSPRALPGVVVCAGGEPGGCAPADPVHGEELARERIIPIDIIPRLVSASEWDVLRRGLTQRHRALNCFLADIYGEGRILADGVVPVALVRGCPQYRTEMRAVQAPFGTYVSICGTDIVRTHDGFMVLEDNLRVPSGVSCMLANRQAVKTSLRDLYRRHRVRSIENYGGLLRKTLAELAPSGISDPTIVLMTPGVYNSAFYEHMFLAQELWGWSWFRVATSSYTTASCTCARRRGSGASS